MCKDWKCRKNIYLQLKRLEPILTLEQKRLEEWKETKDKTGGYLNLKLEIIDGNYKGRLLFENLNLQNSNEKAVKIAQETLAKICKAIGKDKVQNSEELHNIPLNIKIGVTPGRDGYDPSNRVKSFSKTSGQSQSTVQPQAETKPPWAK